jgi:hypothetical protein
MAALAVRSVIKEQVGGAHFGGLITAVSPAARLIIEPAFFMALSSIPSISAKEGEHDSRERSPLPSQGKTNT